MSAATRFAELEVAGNPRQMGRQIGEAAGTLVRGFLEVALMRAAQMQRVSRAAAIDIAARCVPYAEAYCPDMVDELRGVAEAAGLSLEEVMFLQVRNQLHADQDAACTSLSLGRAGLRHGGVVAQNWDNDPALDEFTIVLTRRPAGKPALMNVTQAGLIAYIGFSETGIGLCLNTLPAPARRVGVPHYFTVRGIYEAHSLEGVVEAVRRAERAIPANIMLCTPQGPADLEVTLDGVHVLGGDGSSAVMHTNHCLHPQLAPINEQFPELVQSHARQRRIETLMQDAADHQPVVAHIQAALRDHDGHPRSLCRHPNDDPETGPWQTVFSVIIEPTHRRMHITRGTPCDRPYETYSMA
jgi:isopenicillin-N N-acyltransferase-like protein